MRKGANLSAAKRYAPWLWLLLALFCFRVMAQLIALTTSPTFLPAFDAWHSATVPYWVLLASQFLIAAIMAVTAWRFSEGNMRPRPIIGRVLVALGSIYLGFMLLRLALGITVLTAHPWFGKILPTIFHLVLATFLLLVGLFHVRGCNGKG
jgi:hypothetical protein